MNTIWGIARDEATDLLIQKKIEAQRSELRLYLKLQGLQNNKINEFMVKNSVGAKLREYPELRALRRKPEKLMKAVQELK